MNKSLLGTGRRLWPIPQFLWQREVRRGGEAARRSLRFMGADHHRVRDFAVLELLKRGMPLRPELITASLELSPERTGAILDELEARMIFLFRNEEGDVAWAYPVTAEPTSHRIFFSSGEQIYAA